jgi:hypothetical protein
LPLPRQRGSGTPLALRGRRREEPHCLSRDSGGAESARTRPGPANRRDLPFCPFGGRRSCPPLGSACGLTHLPRCHGGDIHSFAEREGFEPSRELAPPTRLAGECLRPLGHLSPCRSAGARAGRAEGVGFEPTGPRMGPSSFQDCRLRPLGHPSRAPPGGGGGIRTHGTGNPVQQFSRLPPSAARPPLPARCRCGRSIVPGAPRRASYRRSWKKASSRAAHSPERTPAISSHRWLRRSS